jgi:hypothetical protein
MNWKAMGGSGHGLIEYTMPILLEGLTETMKNLSHDSWSLGRDLNMRPSE